MEEWKVYKIGDICSNVCSGGTPTSTHSEYYDGDIPWLNTKEICFNRIHKTERNITEEGLNNSSAKWIPENTVIVAMYGATAGKTAIAKIPLTTNQACCNLTINSEIADYRFVYYYLLNKYSVICSLANGGAQQNLNAQIIKDFKINLPPTLEQTRIASFLSSLDDKIEINKRINDNLEQQAQALFKSWFVDFEPFKDQPFEESELGMIPKGWKCSKLKEVSTKITDGVHNTVKDDPNGKCLLLSCKNIKGGKITYGNDERKISEDTFNKLRKRTNISKGDILLSSVGTLGELVLLNEDLPNIEFQRSVAIIKPNSNILTSHFLYFSLINQKKQIINSGHGAVQQCLFLSDIAELTTIIPPKEEMDRFTKYSISLMNKIVNLQHESRRLAQLRDLLLPKLMSGELKINDVEKNL